MLEGRGGRSVCKVDGRTNPELSRCTFAKSAIRKSSTSFDGSSENLQEEIGGNGKIRINNETIKKDLSFIHAQEASRSFLYIPIDEANDMVLKLQELSEIHGTIVLFTYEERHRSGRLGQR